MMRVTALNIDEDSGSVLTPPTGFFASRSGPGIWRNFELVKEHEIQGLPRVGIVPN